MRSLFIITFCIGSLFAFMACTDRQPDSADTTGTQTDSTQALSEAYKNARYNISLRMPKEWIVIEEQNLKPAMGSFAINLFNRGTGAGKDVPMHVHAKAQHSYVAIWPHGIGTELPASQYASFDSARNTPDLQFPINTEESRILQLKSDSAWAYFLVPAQPPEHWNPHGFIFAQIRTTNTNFTCYEEETGKQIPLDRCDFLAGDRFVREGTLNQIDRRQVHNILESISLDSVKKQTAASDLINIKKPLPNMDITSPLTVQGEARGQWYFEGDFQIELVDSEGNTLAETYATAQEPWMTEDFVPFTATLTFEAPHDERGQLIFHRANPSGLPEHDNKYVQPVIFPPQ